MDLAYNKIVTFYVYGYPFERGGFFTSIFPGGEASDEVGLPAILAV